MHLPERRRFLKTCAALGAGAAPWGCGLMGPYTLPGYTAPKNETDVAEEGTEAAAATAVTMTLFKSATPVEPPIPNFHADHPFLYAIRHRPSGAILFIGRVEYPG